MKKYVFDKYSGSGVKLLEQVVIYASDLSSAFLKARQIHGTGFVYLIA